MNYKNVFCNRTLNMKRISHIGLDMDHTLVRYHSDNFEALAYQVMLEKLVKHKDYPKDILNFKFDFNKAIRGLVIDKSKGNLLKLSRHGAIRMSRHGESLIDYKRQNQLYKSTYIDLSAPDYDTVDTTFSIAFAALFAQLVDYKDNDTQHRLPDYASIARDLNFVLDRGHRDGSIKDVVAEDLDKFVIKDPETVAGLERYIKHGKKFFLLTNSDYNYTKLLLDELINPFCKDTANWQELFEYTITSAQKPRFFFDNLKFLKIDPEDGSMNNVPGKLTPGIYQGGCADVFTFNLDLEPEQILYVGDHIYGDIVRLKKDCAWRTALILEELEDEVSSSLKAKPFSDQIETLMAEKRPLERKIDDLISEKIETGNNSLGDQVDENLKKVNEIDQKLGPLIQEQQKLYNQHWGEVMRVGNEVSYFAYQVERFACIYSPKLSDILALSPRTYFRAERHPLPHES